MSRYFLPICLSLLFLLVFNWLLFRLLTYRLRLKLKLRTEVDIMRDELIVHMGQDFHNRIDATFGQDPQKTLADIGVITSTARENIDIINGMSDDQVKQLYYETFNRWHPLI